jgi:hypothetical protein
VRQHTRSNERRNGEGFKIFREEKKTVAGESVLYHRKKKAIQIVNGFLGNAMNMTMDVSVRPAFPAFPASRAFPVCVGRRDVWWCPA